MAVSYKSLLTMDDVTRQMQNAFPGYDPSLANTQLVVEGLIDEVSLIMDGLLSRTLIVQKYETYFQFEDWDYDEARDSYFVRTLFPIVEIDTSGFTAAKSRHSLEDDIITYSSRFSGLVNYYAGYKRSEQVLGDFTGTFPDLGTLPGDLPGDVKNVAISGVLHALAERNLGPGQRERTINPAVQSTTVREPLRDYLMRIIKERIPHRRIVT